MWVIIVGLMIWLLMVVVVFVFFGEAHPKMQSLLF
jgi:hypothetical protein